MTIPPWLIKAIVAGLTLHFLLDEEKEMFDCSREILKFHDENVNLPEATRTLMRDRRDANRTRLENGLLNNGKPQVEEFVSQGSYAMRTMIQAEDNDIDIDDGAYFAANDLKTTVGSDMSPRSVREMIWNIIKDKDFKTPPEIMDNCVRVYYNEGYKVDIPAYRKVTASTLLGGTQEYYELASKDQWRRSNPRGVTEWFTSSNKEKSPDGEQMRRVVRLLKDFMKRDSATTAKGPSGFIITKLVDECYVAHEGRDDLALYYTMRNIRDRLKSTGLEVDHPVPEIDEKLTKGPDDPKTAFFRDQLDATMKDLQVLFETKSAKEALAAWGKVFHEREYFEGLVESHQAEVAANKNEIGAPSIWLKSDKNDGPPAVDKKGGGRYG